MIQEISRRKVLAVDIDETLNNLVSTLLHRYNKKYKDKVKFEDISEYSIHKFLKSKCKNIFAEFGTEKLFDRLTPKEGSILALSKLNDIYDIYFVTAGHPVTMLYRDKWLKKYYDSFYKTSQLVMCRDKYLFNCDILIDDYVENLLKMPNTCTKILFSQPWNINFNAEKNGMIRVNDWIDILKILMK